MRKSGFYPKLAWGNIVRNRQFYVPYLLTLGGTAAAFYIIGALAGARDLPVMNRYIYLSMFMTFGLFVIAVFAVIFLGYTNSFLMKRRRKELGLYNVLGMGKRNIARMLGMETVYTALIGIGGGILAGLLLQKLVTLLLCRIMAFHGTGFSFYVSREGILTTIALFTLILLGNLLVNLIRVGRQSPMELMRSASAGEREPKSNWPMAILGILALGGGYAIAVFTNNAGMAFALYFPAVILVIIGTYALFTAVSIVVLKALRKNKRYYYQPRHFIGVSSMLYRMRRNAVGLANICILSTMVLVMVSGTLALYLNSQQTLEKQFPAELSVAVRYQADQTPAFDGDAFSARLLAELREKDCPAEILYSYRRFTLSMDEIPGGYFRRHEYQSQTKDINFLTAADAEAITGQQLTDFAPVTLRFPLTAAAEQGSGGADEYSEITVEAAKLTETVPAVGGAFVNINVPVWLAVKDDAALRAVWDTQAAAQRVRIPGSSPNAMVFQTFCRLTLQKKFCDLIGDPIQLIPVSDRETRQILDMEVTFFDIHSTKARQFGFRAVLPDGKIVCCPGDEPLNPLCEEFARGADWLFHEAFCLYRDREIFSPYEKHHSTVKDACELAERLGARHLILWHTEDKTYPERAALYRAEGEAYYHGDLLVPEDGSVIEL